MLSLYLSEPSWLHRVKPGIKLLALAAASMALLPSKSLVLLLTISMLAVLGYLSLLAPGRRRLVALLKTAGLLAGLVGVFQFGLIYPSSGLALAGELALVSALRLLALVMLADLVSVTTPVTEMLAVFRRILAPLDRLGMSTDTLTLLVGLLIRATSLIHQRLQTIQDAYRVRCGGSAGIRAMAPLVRQTFEANHRLAEALEARSLRVQPSYQQATGQASSSRD